MNERWPALPCLAVLTAALLGACTAAAQEKAAPEAYRLSAGDTLQVEVWDEEELSGTYVVAPSGVISRTWVPETPVAGMTLEEATRAYEATLRKYIKVPRVKMSLAAGKSAQVVRVTGAVNRIGSFPYREGYTALDAIIDASGFSKFAAPNRAKIIRGHGKQAKEIPVPLGDVVNRGDKSKNVPMLPGDVLIVPESWI